MFVNPTLARTALSRSRAALTGGAMPSPTGTPAPGGIDERLTIQGGPGGTVAPIVAPPPPSLTDSLAAINSSGALPSFQSIPYAPVGGVTNTLDDNYFKTLEDAASKKLQDKYFGSQPDSLARQNQMNINKRGLIGSGIEQGANSMLNKQFGDELVNQNADFAAQRGQAEQQVAFKNKDIELANAQQQQAAAQADRQFQGFLSELGLRSAADEEKTLGAYNSDIFKSKVENANNLSTNQTNLMDQLNKALGNDLISPSDRTQYANIFDSNIARAFNYTPTAAETAAKQKSNAARPQPPTTPGQVGEQRRGADGGQYVYTRNGTWVQI